MSDVNVVHRDPQKAGGNLPNQLTDNVKRKFIGTGKRLGVSFKLACGKFQDHFQLLQFEFSVSQFGRVIRVCYRAASVRSPPHGRKSALQVLTALSEDDDAFTEATKVAGST